MDAQADRTELRLKLFQNGFEPLPDKDKMCLVKDWPTIPITPALIQSREWARSREFLNTGIRCGYVVALDLDIDDKVLLNDLADALIEQAVIAESDFVRIGRPPRELWAYRIATPIGKRTTGGFAILPLAKDPEQQAYATVEVLGKGSQFAAFGKHPKGFDYTWPVKSPLDHRFAELPEITAEQITRVIEFTIDFFEKRGMPRRSAGATMDGHYNRVYDLQPGMIFNVKDHGPLPLAEIQRYLEVSPDEVLRCTVETLRPTTTGSWAGMISLVQGTLCISDHGDYTAHYPVDLDTTTPLARLGAILAQRMPSEDDRLASIAREIIPGLDPEVAFDTNLDIALKRYVYVKADDEIRDIADNSIGYPLKHFQSLLAQYYRVDKGPRGGEKMTRLSEAFMMAPQRINVASAEMRPDRPYPLYKNGERHYNTWRPIVLPSNGSPELGFDLIERLLPRPEERRWFLQWLACKVRNPSIRGPGVVMVASNTFGTGRGSLITLMSDMLGEDYVRRIDFDTLTGRNYQAQYNDWMAKSLLIAVDEAQESNQDRSRWQSRQNAYERIKSVVDPNNARVEIKRKGVDNYQGTTFASLFVATNHADALVIPANDRRLAVLENGQPMPADYWVRFHAWRTEPGNVGAFMMALGNIDIAGYEPYGTPPMTAMKAEMVDAGASDLDRAINIVLREAPGALMVREQLILKLENFMVSNSVEFPDEWRQAAGRIFVRLTRRSVREWVTYEGKNRQLRQLRNADESLLASDQSVLDELAKNGPAERGSSGKVIPFSRERAS
jgi:hypothetical protein